MSKPKVIVIGGGASGIIAAIIAARNGAKVTIIERKDKIGKKILATGNGRCNISNRGANISRFHTSNPSVDLIENVLNDFGVNKTIDFFDKLGIGVIEKDDNKLYPRSEQANAVVRALLHELNSLNISLMLDTEVIDIVKDKKFKVITKDKTYYGNCVVLAGGGKSSPDLGSNGSGFNLAKKLNHNIIEPFPSIVQLKTDDPYLKHLKGTKFNGYVSILDDNKSVLRKEYGEVLFTDYGVSGPPVLQVSYIGGKRIQLKLKTILALDMVPEIDKERLDSYMIKRFSDGPTKTIEENLIGFINSRLIIPILKKANIDIHKKSCDITKSERYALVNTLKAYEMGVTGTNQWNQSQVTAGGISLSEVDHNTLESKLISDLYFCGEVLDVDGDCGGYNLQWAWSSGFVVGKSIVEKVKNDGNTN